MKKLVCDRCGNNKNFYSIEEEYWCHRLDGDGEYVGESSFVDGEGQQQICCAHCDAEVWMVDEIMTIVNEGRNE